jgi:phosphotransferase system HPr (HPr) family protein
MLHQKQFKISRQLRNNDIATIISVANEFQSEIHIRKENKQVNLKSSLGVYSLMLAKNDQITLIAHGIDAEKALEALYRFFTP